MRVDKMADSNVPNELGIPVTAIALVWNWLGMNGISGFAKIEWGYISMQTAQGIFTLLISIGSLYYLALKIYAKHKQINNNKNIDNENDEDDN